MFLGENWYGSCARACSMALRRHGVDVYDLDIQTFLPSWSAIELRLGRRLMRRKIIDEYNRTLLSLVEAMGPDFVLAFKGEFVRPSTLRNIKGRGIAVYNYFPDRVVFFRETMVEESLNEYDYVFDTKLSWDEDMAQRLNLRGHGYLPHGYDPDVHFPRVAKQRDIEEFSCDVSLIATYSPRKETLLADLLLLNPSLDLKIFGNAWSACCHTKSVRTRVQNRAVTGDLYARAIRASKINLGLMGIRDGAVDTASTRTFEIPACRGFMLHERTSELASLFEEDREVACFESPGELATKISHYLTQECERARISANAYRRCVPHYSYDARMQTVIDYFERTRGKSRNHPYSRKPKDIAHVQPEPPK